MTAPRPSLSFLRRISCMANENCRNDVYPGTDVMRYPVYNHQVDWKTPMEDYCPPFYEMPNLESKSWADPSRDDVTFLAKWNRLDGKIDRRSWVGKYKVVNGMPQNPCGRTGLAGRGLLGKWGPNHAADPIVTRWKGAAHPKSALPILQFCAIQRKDNEAWAIPGGMIDAGASLSETLVREFLEEALNILQKESEEVEKFRGTLAKFFSKCDTVYQGYVDDPRNTDNAWIETTACNYHDEFNQYVSSIEFEAGDDAKNVRWIDIDSSLRLHANHLKFIHKVAALRKAHF